MKYYSTHCGPCETFTWLMDVRGIEYTVVTDEDDIKSTVEKYSVETFPFAIINGEFFNTEQLLKYILDYNK